MDIPTINAMLAALPDPAVALDGAGQVIAFNRRAQILGPALRVGGAVSLGLRMPEVIAAIRDVATTGLAARTEFSERVPIDRWYAAHISPIRANGPGTASDGVLLITFEDLTPLRRAEQMRVDFVANASHELRTPLASLTGFIETLRGPARDDPPARARFLDIMQAQALRMARLIDDLLSLSRIELNAHVRPESPLDLIPVIRQVVDSMQTLARDREVAINLDAPARPLMVRGDRDELTRVFENLIENALKYGAVGKRVDIVIREQASDDGREGAIVIRDYGPGIAAEHLPRLTERFYRVDVAHSRAEGGTGLGLALVKHVVNRHGGRLMIESKPGEGAAFTVRMALIEAGKP